MVRVPSPAGGIPCLVRGPCRPRTSASLHWGHLSGKTVTSTAQIMIRRCSRTSSSIPACPNPSLYQLQPPENCRLRWIQASALDAKDELRQPFQHRRIHTPTDYQVSTRVSAFQTFERTCCAAAEAPTPFWLGGITHRSHRGRYDGSPRKKVEHLMTTTASPRATSQAFPAPLP